ncbi:MAG: bifunctional 5,10-methylenetetrahydrofolate dehydrogenase/5,10-methenyltetrahydrofolate cyclohydrolase [Patescibacteria group bacterium]|nr:bifunctional 5,10-methylenetetrahydrofolate dehydrogenase/5,10-methenyltetrahydrofolate cyclohydrolase [Patescibacteria group bacterium]
MKTIDGKKIAAKKLLALKDEINEMEAEPTLAVILIGDDPASHLYVDHKEKAAKEIGIELRKYLFDENVVREDVKASIEFLNSDPETHSIIVQLPLPEQLDTDDIVGLIDPDKDVDGFHPINQKKFLNNEECIFPVFPRAILSLIESEEKNIANKKAVVIGKSDIFDNVMTHALAIDGAETQFISSEKNDPFNDHINDVINAADIIVTACGKPNMISCDVISDDTIVIDGGISKVNGKTVGDVDTTECEKRKITISPVPGGVGPVTIACLLENVVELAKK